MRKLVTVRTISEIFPIVGADAIEVAVVDGWKVVARKDQFRVNEKVVYFEIDSFLPEADSRYKDFMKNTRKFNDVLGHKLKSIRLRGQLSQGLIMPLSAFPEIVNPEFDTDYSELLGIMKYEAPVPAQLAGVAKGNFPAFIQKTDQERCQNLVYEIFVKNIDTKYEVTLKLNGASCTFYNFENNVGVCSRNLELKIEENKFNTMVRIFNESNLMKKLQFHNKDIAIQGEIVGPGIQKNAEKMPHVQFHIFDIFDIKTGDYYTPQQRIDFINNCLFNSSDGITVDTDLIKHIPILYFDTTISELDIRNIDELLNFAEGKSILAPNREGIVFKSMDGKFSFKSISNSFLLG